MRYINAVVAAIDENIRNVIMPPYNLYRIPPIKLPIAKPNVINNIIL